MKKFLGIIFLTFIFSSSASANNLDLCNEAVKQLKKYGYTFQNFKSGKNQFIQRNALFCGFPPNSEQMITFISNPSRFHVTTPWYWKLQWSLYLYFNWSNNKITVR